MRILTTIAAMVADFLAPDSTVVRNRARITFDRLLTLVVMLLAIALAIGYQVLGRWGHLIFGEDE